MAKSYSILKKIFNKEGVNDGVLYQVVDTSFNVFSNHKTMKAAEKKVKQLNKKK